ncbi:hypothetical protein EV286_114109 [Rhizobium sp. BK251]|nr:hypothetical protein EV286_114109 [Rhizobium sp. BK251]
MTGRPYRPSMTSDVDDTTFPSSTEFAGALRCAEADHGDHEKRPGQRDADWPNWNAEYIANKQASEPPPL